MIKIAYASDLHLDCLYNSEFEKRIALINEVEADYLVLAGDITNNRDYLEHLSLIKPKVKKVIYVLGNHEFYRGDLHDDWYFGRLPHVHFLHNSNPYITDEVSFVGDTLWTHIPDKMEYDVSRFMNDYRMIFKDRKALLTVGDTNHLHQSQSYWLLTHDLPSVPVGSKIVMVSHHSPSFKGVSSKYEGHRANHAFHSNILARFSMFPISVWIHGHTHDKLNYVQDGVNVVCNPWGYMNEVDDYGVEYVYLK